MASAMLALQGHRAARRRRSLRPPRATRPAPENRRSSQPFGFPAAGTAGEGSHSWGPGEQLANEAAIWHQTWSWSYLCSGRFRSPVSLARRMRSSKRARRRCRSSRSASWPFRVDVAKQVIRWPATAVNRSWAPGCGRSVRASPARPGSHAYRRRSPRESAPNVAWPSAVASGPVSSRRCNLRRWSTRRFRGAALWPGARRSPRHRDRRTPSAGGSLL
jgi:hypothetical protein